MEFENLQIEVPLNDESSPMFAAKIYEKKYKNKKDFVVGFNPEDKEFTDRKNRRAKRFGIQKKATVTTSTSTITGDSSLEENSGVADNEELAVKTNKTMNKKLYQKLDTEYFKSVDLQNIDWPPVLDCALDEMRLDAVHVYGVEHMSTNDIFQYFDLFGPDTLEWIDDYSCNVVWEDEAAVTKVIESMSKSYNVLKEIQRKENEDNENGNTVTPPVNIKIEEDRQDSDTVLIEDDEEDIDPKDVWRLGFPYKEQQIFLRPSTINDKKLPGAASRSQYYLMYGKNGEKKTKGIVSESRKRKLEVMKKRANEIFKLKEPDVKIVALDDLAEEGIIAKMEVDDDMEEPVVKRLNLDIQAAESGAKSRTMVADRLEVAHRLGMNFDDGLSASNNSIHNRLGVPGDDSLDDPSRTNDLRARLENNKLSSIHDRLGKRSEREPKAEMEDARGEIERSKRSQKTKNSRHRYREDGYEEDGVYHDIYRADDDVGVKQEPVSTPSRSRRSRPAAEHDEREERRGSVKSRLGNTNSSGENSVRGGDLRDKLRGRGATDRQEKEQYVKDEHTEESRLNLCIEVKREPAESEEMDFEF